MALSKEDIDDIKVGRALEAMIATEGWRHFVRLLDHHIETKRAECLRPFHLVQETKAKDSVLFSSLDSLAMSESLKGAILGLSLAKSLPSGIISNMNDVLSRAKGEGNEVEE